MDSCKISNVAINWGVAPFVFKTLYEVLVINILQIDWVAGISYGVGFDLEQYLIGFALFFIITFIACLVASKSSPNVSVFVKLLYYIYVVPLIASTYINSTTLWYTFSVLTYVISLFLCIFILCHKQKNILQPWESFDTIKFYNIISATCLFLNIAVVLYAINYNGFNITVDIWNVYDARAMFVGSTNKFESFILHANDCFAAYVSIMLGIRYKRYLQLTVGIFAVLAIFSVAREKTTLFLGLIALVVGYLKNINFYKVDRLISLFATLLMVVTTMLYYAFNDITLFMLIVRRVFYMPAWLAYIYFDFFSQNAYLFFSQDVFGLKYLNIPMYQYNVLDIINYSYFYGMIPSPNTGMFAEAFMHIGYAGIIIFPLFFAIFVKCYLSSLNVFYHGLALFFIIKVVVSVTNVPITNSVFVLSYGFFVTLVIVIKSRCTKRNPIAR